MKKITLKEQFNAYVDFYPPIYKYGFRFDFNISAHTSSGYLSVDIEVFGVCFYFSYRSKEEVIKHRKRMIKLAKEIGATKVDKKKKSSDKLEESK